MKLSSFLLKKRHLPQIAPPSVLFPKEQKSTLRHRWMLNSMSSVLLILIIVVTLFAMFFRSYCYRGMLTGLENKAKAASDFFSSYATTERAYLSMANTYISEFDERDRLELQFINTRGQIILSSFGLTSGGTPGTSDIDNAISSQSLCSFIGANPSTNERIMAVSSPIIRNGEVRGVMRLVTSLSKVDVQILFFVLLVILVGILIVTLVYVVNMYFIRSVIEPITQVTTTASTIASGRYGIQMEKLYNDEIGELIDAINNMSSKISESEKMKSEFISSISHELRTPLTAINGWSETLLTGEITDEASVKKGLSIITSEGHRLSKMVEELLEFSRIEDGRFTLNIEPVDLQAEFEDAIFTYQQFYKKNNIQLRYHSSDDILDPIQGDPQRLRQVFSNVLDNAAKHGGGNQRIEASLYKEGDFVVIRIRDHGAGIPEKDLPHVKEMFYKASSKVRGSGIGLAVCDEIVTRHGGILDIANAEGGGCVVTISLPVTTPAQTT